MVTRPASSPSKIKEEHSCLLQAGLLQRPALRRVSEWCIIMQNSMAVPHKSKPAVPAGPSNSTSGTMLTRTVSGDTDICALTFMAVPAAKGGSNASVCGGMAKRNVMCTYSGIFFSLKKEGKFFSIQGFHWIFKISQIDLRHYPASCRFYSWIT